MNKSILPTLFFMIFLGNFMACPSHGQMEKRKSEEYLAKQFAESKPAIGEVAPDFQLRTLNGDAVLLSSYLGKNVVIIKGGYT